MRIDEKVWKAMPKHLQDLFLEVHNPSRDEVLAAFPFTQSGKQAAGGHVRNPDKTRNAYGSFKGERCEGNVLYGDGGSAARFFYTAKASASDRTDGLHTISKAGRNGHSTVKPTDLMRYLCRLVTPPGGTVLDPFMGSGSTLKAAELEGFDAIGIELDPTYVAIAQRRVSSDAPLFADVLVGADAPDMDQERCQAPSTTPSGHASGPAAEASR